MRNVFTPGKNPTQKAAIDVMPTNRLSFSGDEVQITEADCEYVSIITEYRDDFIE